MVVQYFMSFASSLSLSDFLCKQIFLLAKIKAYEGLTNDVKSY